MEAFEAFFEEKSLTKQQRSVLEAIIFLLRKGEMPTVREVGAIVGLRSPATVLKHLRVLEKTGLISLSGKSRGIRIADDDLLRCVFTPPDAATDGAGAEPSDALQVHLAQSLRGGAFSGAQPLSLGRDGLGRDGLGRDGLGAPGAERLGGKGGNIVLAGAIAAGQPFESYADGFLGDGFSQDPDAPDGGDGQQNLPIDPSLFASGGELFALRIEGDSMIRAGILDGDYVIVRRQNSVEEGEIAAVLIDGEGTLKRWTTHNASRTSAARAGSKTVRLLPENERFEPIEVHEDEAKDVLVLGKYIGLVRGDLQIA